MKETAAEALLREPLTSAQVAQLSVAFAKEHEEKVRTKRKSALVFALTNTAMGVWAITIGLWAWLS